MTQEEILLVKKSWRLFRDVNPVVVGDTFYGKLFTDHPGVRKMFPKEMKLQYQKLMDMISTIVARLDHLEELTEDIEAMSRRHVSYGVKPEQYKIVGEALLWTLEQGLGPDYTPDVKQAWVKCYTLLSTVMINSSES